MLYETILTTSNSWSWYLCIWYSSVFRYSLAWRYVHRAYLWVILWRYEYHRLFGLICMAMSMTEFERKRLCSFARRDWETAHKMDWTGVAESNKNAVRFDLCGMLATTCFSCAGSTFSALLQVVSKVVIRSVYVVPVRIINHFLATSERLCNITRLPALQKSEISCLTRTAKLCTWVLTERMYRI